MKRRVLALAMAVLCGAFGCGSGDGGGAEGPPPDASAEVGAGNSDGGAAGSDASPGADASLDANASADADGGATDDGGIVTGGPLQFEVGRPYPAKFSSRVAIADFTGDGLPDLVGLNHWDDFIEVKPGDGKGAFGAAITTAHNHFQQEVFALADYDGDGDQDVALPKGTQLDWFINDGKGHFSAGPSTALASAFDEVVVIDVTGDGRLDVVASSYGTLSVYAGLAGGGFSTTGRDSPCLTAGLGVQVGDFNGDGHLDVAMGSTTSVAVCRGDGTGSFAAGDKYTVAGGATLYASPPGPGVRATLYMATSQGVTAFDDIQGGALVNAASVTTAQRTLFVGAGDFNGDAKPDLLVATWDGGSDFALRVYGREPSGFGLTGTYDWSSGGAVVGDVNKDGALDLVHDTGFEVVVVRGRGDGTLRAAPKWALATSGTLTRVVDVTGDGRPDIVAVGGSRSLGVFVAQANGSPTALAPALLSGSPTALELADFDGDGRVDVLFSRRGPDGLDLLPGDGKGAFGAPQTLNALGGEFAIGDIDGDAKPDLVQIASPGLTARLSKSGTWKPVAGITDWIGWHRLRDFDGDGRLDLVALSDDGTKQALHFLKGHGDGTFDTSIDTPQAAGYGVDVADLDGDRDLDLVTAAGGVSAFLFDAGHFGPPIVTTGAKLMYLRELALADFDNDGHVDLAYSGGYGMVVLKGDGTGRFASAFEFATQYVDSLAVGDVDRDGRIDLVGNAEGVWFGRNVTGLP